MFYRADEDHGLPHNPFIACVVPRPIGWISTLSVDGVNNLAPYSLFNIVRYAPPSVMFAANGTHGQGGMKDTAKNAIETGEFVYNMATFDLREQVNESSSAVDRATDEMAMLGMETVPSRLVRPLRLKNSPIQFECKTIKSIELPGGQNDNTIVFGDVVGIHIADDVLTDGLIDIAKIQPLARMGYMDFSYVDKVFAMPRPSSGGVADTS